MIDGKVIISAILGMVLTVGFLSSKNKTRENFWNTPSRQIRVDKVMAPSKEAAVKGDFVSVPNFQASLSPRFANVDVGANIRYNPPSEKHMAAPPGPLGFAQQGGDCGCGKQGVKEGFCSDCGGCAAKDSSSLFLGAPVTPPNYAQGDYNQVVDSVYDSKNNVGLSDANVPIGDMTVVDSLGQTSQPIIYDRYMFANRNSRLRSQGDMIRGDLSITPCNYGWFQPSVNPAIDLQQGAMNVMGGTFNQTAQNTAHLIHHDSGRTQTTIGGVNLANEFVEQSGPSSIVQVSSFA